MDIHVGSSYFCPLLWCIFWGVMVNHGFPLFQFFSWLKIGPLINRLILCSWDQGVGILQGREVGGNVEWVARGGGTLWAFLRGHPMQTSCYQISQPWIASPPPLTCPSKVQPTTTNPSINKKKASPQSLHVVPNREYILASSRARVLWGSNWHRIWFPIHW